MQPWIAAVGVRTVFIEPGSPWENGTIVSFNVRLRDELLNGELFFTLSDAHVLIEARRRHYNEVRPDGSMGYPPPALETIIVSSWTPGSAPPVTQFAREVGYALTFNLGQPVGDSHLSTLTISTGW